MKKYLSRTCLKKIVLFFFLVSSGLFGQKNFAQSLVVLESTGFVETNLQDVGWRQAVVGRQIPEGSILTSWLNAKAELEGEDFRINLEPMTHVRLISLDSSHTRLALSAGALIIESTGCILEVEIRGKTIHLEQGVIRISDERLEVISGTAILDGYDKDSIRLDDGSEIIFSTVVKGPIFPLQE